MGKIGRPEIEGQRVLVKIPKNLLEDIDEIWPKVGSGSRNDFIRRILWDAIQKIKFEGQEVAAPCS
ncbi:MAG: ribbon-helix-helix domain-containing protein [Candidatus Bathyarchaeia archaeon]|uniref:ribbon-helix-helix domain-containing protein n=1 Tax=Candidatus Hadarchaeum sp. TaxID=2883567 RepID=UPI00317C6716